MLDDRLRTDVASLLSQSNSATSISMHVHVITSVVQSIVKCLIVTGYGYMWFARLAATFAYSS